MAEMETSAIALTPELMAKVAATAQTERRSVNELVAAAVKRYLHAQDNHEALVRWGHEYGRSLGINSDSDVERMADEWRAEQRTAL